jgi:hypothetical protein
MKIIGKTTGGFIVEMTEDEAAQAAGHHSSYSEGWRKLGVGVGAKIDFVAAISFHSRVKAHQDEARKSAGILRALADMIDGALPEVVIPADEQKGDAS